MICQNFVLGFTSFYILGMSAQAQWQSRCKATYTQHTCIWKSDILLPPTGLAFSTQLGSQDLSHQLHSTPVPQA